MSRFISAVELQIKIFFAEDHFQSHNTNAKSFFAIEHQIRRFSTLI